MITFGGIDIFGPCAKLVAPPERPYRAMQRQLPGVDGARVYRLGFGVMTWTVRGRLSGSSAVNLSLQRAANRAMQDGQLRTFVGDGESYTNVMLASYRCGPIQRIAGSSTVTHSCVVDATLVQVAP